MSCLFSLRNYLNELTFDLRINIIRITKKPLMENLTVPIKLNFVTNSMWIVKLKNWAIWTYYASAEAFLSK